jgi:GH24 family phage-related lysozyme (muramidase)
VWVADVNSDGKLDLVVGDCISLISPAEGVKEDEFVKRYAEWKSAYGEAIKEPATSDEKQMEEAQQRMKKLYAQREEFMEEDRTGFVWLYLQK